MIHTHCSTRLGDNIAHLHLLRKLAMAHPDAQFAHAINTGYCGHPSQLIDVVSDLPNITITEQPQPGSVEVWKGHGEKWYSHPKKADWCAFMLEHHADIAKQIGMESPLRTGADLLFDYPLLKAPDAAKFDFLVINSPPMSGQMRGYSPGDFERLIIKLMAKGTVITTHPVSFPAECTQTHNMSITDIGRLSQHCRCIVMVSTGPSWPTFNVWNVESVKLRIVLLDSENLSGLGGNMIQAGNTDEARAVLEAHEYL
jgi:hypothetical protein